MEKNNLEDKDDDLFLWNTIDNPKYESARILAYGRMMDRRDARKKPQPFPKIVQADFPLTRIA
jgi:hypothetical protein